MLAFASGRILVGGAASSASGYHAKAVSGGRGLRLVGLRLVGLRLDTLSFNALGLRLVAGETILSRRYITRAELVFVPVGAAARLPLQTLRKHLSKT